MFKTSESLERFKNSCVDQFVTAPCKLLDVDDGFRISRSFTQISVVKASDLYYLGNTIIEDSFTNPSIKMLAMATKLRSQKLNYIRINVIWLNWIERSMIQSSVFLNTYISKMYVWYAYLRTTFEAASVFICTYRCCCWMPRWSNSGLFTYFTIYRQVL